MAAPGASGTPAAIVVAADEETRVLLRGLLRLHHLRVIGEAEGATVALQLIQEHHPTLLVADANLAEGSCGSLIAEAKSMIPSIRTIMIAPVSRPPPTIDGGGKPDTVLLRPFRIRQFAEVLEGIAPRS